MCRDIKLVTRDPLNQVAICGDRSCLSVMRQHLPGHARVGNGHPLTSKGLVLKHVKTPPRLAFANLNRPSSPQLLSTRYPVSPSLRRRPSRRSQPARGPAPTAHVAGSLAGSSNSSFRTFRFKASRSDGNVSAETFGVPPRRSASSWSGCSLLNELELSSG